MFLSLSMDMAGPLFFSFEPIGPYIFPVDQCQTDPAGTLFSFAAACACSNVMSLKRSWRRSRLALSVWIAGQFFKAQPLSLAVRRPLWLNRTGLEAIDATPRSKHGHR